MRVLYIGGTGQISLPCVAEDLKAGHKVAVFNRGKVDADLPAGVETLVGDMNDEASYRALGEQNWDVVCQFMAFTPDRIAKDIEVFTGRIGQYIFISSASVYQKPPHHYIITEKTPAVNPYWQYSQQKIACEQLLMGQSRLPWTIVRPSHTVRTGLPNMANEGDYLAERMLAGKPVIVAGDGTSPWTLTRSADFAVPFVRLFGKAAALGEIFHITSDRGYGWDHIYQAIGRGLGVEVKIVHVPSDTLVRYNKAWEGPLIGDKSQAALFDNSKVKAVAGPFTCSENLDEVLADSIANFRKRQAAGIKGNAENEKLIDRIIREQSALGA